MNNPIISVIMSVYDTAFLGEAVESILNQTFRDFEFIIVVDNPDNEILIESVNAYVEQDERIKLLINERNLGLGNSLNRGLEVAQGEYIARMDSDDISLPTRLEMQKQFLDANTDIGLVGCCAIRIDEDGSELGEMKLPSNSATLRKMLPYTTAAYHPTWMLRCKTIEKVGVYRCFPVAQDYDFLFRCIDCGIKISNIQDVLFKYRVSTHNASVAKFLDQWNVRKYIQKLHRQRVKRGTDSFSKDELSKVLTVSELRRWLCGKSQAFFEKGVIAKRSGKKASFLLYTVMSVVVYPPKLEVLYSTFRSKLVSYSLR